jgi:pilus assembly protein Flp/PilA
MQVKAMRRIFEDESGATAIEYGLIAALVAVAAIAAFSAVGDALTAVFTRVGNELNSAVGVGGGAGGGGGAG